MSVGDALADFDLSRRILRLPEWAQLQLVRSLTWPQARDLEHRWSMWSHPGQFRPPGNWRVWLIRAGRGFGKTRAGAEWVSAIARAVPGAAIALVGGSRSEVRQVMIDGPSGLRAVALPNERLTFSPTTGELRFSSGATAYVYTANAPEGLRGPQHHAAWCDELGKWRYPAAWDNLVMGLRGGGDPRVLVTTTPRQSETMQKVLAAEGLVVTHGTTRDNPHLPPAYLSAMVADYGDTRLGRQEIEGEVLEDIENALWSRARLDACRIAAAPPLVRVVIGVDPPASADGDACGIVACGVDAAGTGYVLEDASLGGASPEGWARAVAACAARWNADRVVAEKNNGGDMVRSVLSAADAGLPVKLVHASRGKAARAEPVAAKYELGKVRHVVGSVGAFVALEDELAGLLVGGGYVATGPNAGKSPDRADACVWALTELMLGKGGKARVRAA